MQGKINIFLKKVIAFFSVLENPFLRALQIECSFYRIFLNDSTGILLTKLKGYDIILSCCVNLKNFKQVE